MTRIGRFTRGLGCFSILAVVFAWSCLLIAAGIMFAGCLAR